MPNLPPITVSREDRDRIYTLLDDMTTHDEVAERLYDELDRAQILAEQDMPSDVVRLNSRARFTNEATGKEFLLKLVLPSEVQGEDCVSLLSPAGAALLGLKVGDGIEWPSAGKILRLHLNSVDG